MSSQDRHHTVTAKQAGSPFLNHYSLKNSPTKEDSLLLNVVQILLHQFLITLTFCFALRKENTKCQ